MVKFRVLRITWLLDLWKDLRACLKFVFIIQDNLETKVFQCVLLSKNIVIED